MRGDSALENTGFRVERKVDSGAIPKLSHALGSLGLMWLINEEFSLGPICLGEIKCPFASPLIVWLSRAGQT